MREHLKIILDEMARRVGLESIDDVDTTKPDWYNEYEWTEDEMRSYMQWLTDYMMNPKARKQLMTGYPSYNVRKKTREKFAGEVIFQYGWRLGIKNGKVNEANKETKSSKSGS